AQLRSDQADQQAVQVRWEQQRTLAEQVLDLRRQLAEAREQDNARDDVAVLQASLETTRSLLEAAQAKERLVSFEVCPRLVAEVISAWTGVPLEQLAREHNARIMRFAEDLRARIRGQEQAVQALDRSMRANAAGLAKPDAPVGVFLLVGPSGVGKTETALALADLLYGGERFITTINMSEFQEKHTVSRLIGAPP
uniref:ATPase_AAA_core domain-containing protein n=1 Tax=Steinernema glaseri TaxID=37863 RepID=A0A1I8AN18_9BILA